ncbi:MAG: EexN family lipoprotein [Gammaproteobacteria bacterium]|nr:EexN family lipoprotein [Gammaproteobacteria bacterium]
MKTTISKLTLLRNSVIALSATLLLAGCFDGTHSVEWYRKHDSARESMIKECAANPHKMGETENCKNAMAAAAHSSIDKISKTIK